MRRLRGYLLASFLPSMLGGLAFFILVFQIFELLPNIAKFINADAKISEVSKMMFLYLPKCVSYSLPVSILFAVSFSLGNLYARNELVSVYNSGVSLYSFTLPLVAVGIILSIGSFFFDDAVVIDALRMKNETYRRIMKQSQSVNNTEVTVMSHNGEIVYQASFYNAAERSLQGLVIVERARDGAFLSRINAERAVWEEGVWQLQRVRRYYWKPDRSSIMDESLPSYSQPNLDEAPDTFSKSGKNIEEMKVQEAKKRVSQLKKAGFPYFGEEAEYYKRFSFALTPLIVILLSITMGGRFKKNILLMSGLASLVIAAAYYIFQMVTMIFAKLGYLSPIAGAWLPFAVFLAVALTLYRFAKT